MLKWRQIISTVGVILATISSISSLEFSPPLTDTFVVLGRPFWWTCSVLRTGTTSGLTFVWRFQDGDMSSTDQTRIAYGNGTLYFPQVLSSHLGRYTCVVSDSQGPIESSAWLRQAYIAGNVSLTPSQQSVPVGGTAVMECRVDARPSPSISWILGGQRIIKTSRVTMTDVNAGHSMLQISNTTYTDAGAYTCNVSHGSLTQPLSSPPAVVSVYGPPMLTSPPQSQSVPIGYNATFRCEVVSEPKSQVSWRFQANESSGQIPLSTSPPSVVIDDSNGALVLHSVKEPDSGIYTCNWTNPYGKVASSATLTVGGQPQPPVFILRPLDTSVVEGDDLVLNCSGQGNPTPAATWLTTGPDGAAIAVSRDVTIGNDGSLTLRNVMRTDMAAYICVLTNQEGSVESRAFANVLFKPYFVSPLQGAVVSEGSEFTLSCEVAGNPEPTVSWSLPGNPNVLLTADNAGANSDKTEIVLDTGQLVVKKAGRTHHGVFTCIASNKVGSVNMSASVSIIGAPHFSIIPMSQGVIEGDNISLHCQVDTYPAASVEWYYEYMIDPSIQSTDILHLKETLSQSSLPLANMTVLEIGQDPRYSLFNDTSLQILSVQESDAGLYICMARNDKGSAFEPAILRVITFPRFQTTPTDTNAVVGSSVMLNCFAIGIPVPTQRWLFNQGKLVLNSRMSVFVNGSLLIENIQESEFGLYTCLGTNQAGQRSVSAHVTQSALPFFVTSPSNTTAVRASNATLTCRGAASSSFEVSWYLSNSNGDVLQLLGQTVVNKALSPSLLNGNLTLTATASSRLRVTPEGDLVFECLETLDSSWYMCTLRNAEGSTSSDPVFVTVTSIPGNMTVNLPAKVYTATSATLSCKAWGYPKPVISWVTPLKVELIGQYFNDMTVITEQFPDFVTSNLTIRNVQVQRDGGQWMCKACNAAGCRLQGGYLNIEGMAVVRQIISEEYDSEFSISCKTTGIPEPDVTYSTRGVPITDTFEGHRVANKIMFIEKGKAKSEYTCQAVNLFGSIPVTFFTPSSVLISDAKPDSQTVVVGLEHKAAIPSLLPSEVLLQYKTPESTQWQNQTFFLSQDIDNYLAAEMDALQANDSTDASCDNKASSVVKRDTGEATASSENMAVSVESTGTQFVYSIEPELKNLAPNTVYDVRAAMVNALGPGPFSLEIRVTTLAAAPSAVSNLIVNVNNRTASVSWTNPDPLNGRPEDTFITVNLLDGNSNRLADTTLSVLDAPKASFPSLQPGNYAVQVSASNRQTNTTSKPVTMYFQVKDEPPQYIPEISGIRALNSNIIQVNWTLPPTVIIPPVTGFMVQISKAEAKTNSLDSPKVFNVSSASVASWTIRNLQERTEYSVQVASTNSAGRGPYSGPKTVKTPYSEFSDGALDDSSLGYNISWKVLAIIIICICSALIILTIIVILTHQIKLARSKSVDLNPYPEENNNPSPNSSIEEPKRDEVNEERVARVAEGYRNDGFMMY